MKNILKALCVFGIVGLISACSQTTPPVVITQDVPIINAPSPPPVSLQRPAFTVLNNDGVNSACKQITKNNDPNFVVYAMTYDNIQILLNNYNALGDYISGLQAEIDYYKNYLNSLNQHQQSTKQ